jgi:hypothetical protein
MPIIATAANAVNFNNVNTLFTIVPHFVPIALSPVITHTQSTATTLSAQSGVVSLGCNRKKSIRSTYSAKIIAIIAAPPGFNVVIALHEYRNAERGP